MTIEEAVYYLQIYSGLTTLLLFMCWFFAGEWIVAFALTWYKKGVLLIEWTKNKKYRPIPCPLVVGVENVVQLPKNRGPVILRREAIGTGNNKIPMALFSSEYARTINPQEISGEKWVPVEDDELKVGVFKDGQIVDTPREKGGMVWYKWPKDLETVTANAFIEYQQIDDDPMTMENNGIYKEKAIEAKITNPFQQMFMSVAANPVPVIMILLGAGIAYSYINQQNMGQSNLEELKQCQQNIVDIYSTGKCMLQNASGVIYQNLNTGGVVK